MSDLEDPIGKRRRPRQDRARFTVDAILEAAEQLTLEVGFDKASTNKIAERAGVSIGSLYQYFKNKDAIARGLLDRRRTRRMTALMEALRDVSELSVAETIARFVPVTFRLPNEELKLHLALEQQMLRLRTTEELVTVEERFATALVPFLESRRDELQPLPDLYAAAWLIVHTVSSVAATWLMSPELRDKTSEDAVINGMITMAQRYLCREM